MTETGGDIAYLALLLILPVAALAARRLPLGTTLKIALAWAAIFGGLFALVALWQTATNSGAAIGSALR